MWREENTEVTVMIYTHTQTHTQTHTTMQSVWQVDCQTSSLMKRGRVVLQFL